MNSFNFFLRYWLLCDQDTRAHVGPPKIINTLVRRADYYTCIGFFDDFIFDSSQVPSHQVNSSSVLSFVRFAKRIISLTSSCFFFLFSLLSAGKFLKGKNWKISDEWCRKMCRCAFVNSSSFVHYKLIIDCDYSFPFVCLKYVFLLYKRYYSVLFAFVSNVHTYLFMCSVFNQGVYVYKMCVSLQHRL